MAPTRVGIIGLSAKSGQLSPGAWAALAIFPSFQANPDYEVVALCNSSVDAARRAIDFHRLPSSTRAYGDASRLAADPDVDLVVVSVSVDRHLELALPALQAGKDVFVEWPLGATTAEAERLTEAAASSGVRTIIGLQARGHPVLAKARELIRNGTIGDITTSSVVAAFPDTFPDFWIEGIEKYLDIHFGGNSFRITFAHFLDSFQSVVGELDLDTLSAIVHRDTSTIEVRKADLTTVVDPAYPKTAPDHVFVQGRLANGAPASVAFRTTGKTPGDVGVRWVITGTKGEMEITDTRGQWQIESADKKLSVRLFATGQVQTYGVPEAETRGDLGVAAGLGGQAVNTALIIDGYTNQTEGVYVDFANSLKLHKLLDAILDKSGYLNTL